jgi:hypothetical protein
VKPAARGRYFRARIVLAVSLGITVGVALILAAFVAWAVHPLIPFSPYGAAILWLAIVTYLLWVLDVGLKGLFRK